MVWNTDLVILVWTTSWKASKSWEFLVCSSSSCVHGRSIPSSSSGELCPLTQPGDFLYDEVREYLNPPRVFSQWGSCYQSGRSSALPWRGLSGGSIYVSLFVFLKWLKRQSQTSWRLWLSLLSLFAISYIHDGKALHLRYFKLYSYRWLPYVTINNDLPARHTGMIVWYKLREGS